MYIRRGQCAFWSAQMGGAKCTFEGRKCLASLKRRLMHHDAPEIDQAEDASVCVESDYDHGGWGHRPIDRGCMIHVASSKAAVGAQSFGFAIDKANRRGLDLQSVFAHCPLFTRSKYYKHHQSIISKWIFPAACAKYCHLCPLDECDLVEADRREEGVLVQHRPHR